jgi:hypothetical protein
MIAAPVQCDVDGIPKRSHYARVRSQPEHMIHQEAVTKFHDERVILTASPRRTLSALDGPSCRAAIEQSLPAAGVSLRRVCLAPLRAG